MDGLPYTPAILGNVAASLFRKSKSGVVPAKEMAKHISLYTDYQLSEGKVLFFL